MGVQMLQVTGIRKSLPKKTLEDHIVHYPGGWPTQNQTVMQGPLRESVCEIWGGVEGRYRSAVFKSALLVFGPHFRPFK